jgi:zinc protease
VTAFACMSRRLTLLTGTVVLLAAPAHAAARQAGPPPPLPQRPISFPGFDSFMLENGMHVVVVSYGTQPVLSARLYVRGGRVQDPAGKAGLAELTSTLLIRGTESRSAETVSEEIEGVGGSISATAGRDFLTLSAVSLTEHAETAFSLLADVARNASFPPEEVELARRQYLSSLQAELGDPQSLAQRRFMAVLYGEDHPYGVSLTPASVGGITREEVVAFRDRVLQPEGALLLVAGRVDRSEVEALARRHLGDWSGAAPPPPITPPLRESEELTIHLVHRPGLVQSVVLAGHLGIEASDPDYFPLQVMNQVLGGGADSRLNRVLREERGWTYGAFSQFMRGVGRGYFIAQADVRTEVTDSTVVELIHQFERLREEAVPEEELEGARGFLAGSFPLRLETADQVAGQLSTSLLLDLPLEDVTRFPERIRDIDGEAVLRAARSHLHPDRLALVIVGDGAVLAEHLEAIGAVLYYDVDGRLLDRGSIVGASAAASWDGTRLEEGVRRYAAFLGGNPMGEAEYRLERSGDAWVSTVTVEALGSTQETVLRFTFGDLQPLAISQGMSQGPITTRAELEVREGRLVGTLELPAQLGGVRALDEPFPPGTLLAGMDEYALQVVPLQAGARFTLPYFDLIGGGIVHLEARVTGEEEVLVPMGLFRTWRVEVSGGEVPLTLFLRQEAPHILIRQEFAGQPISFDLASLSPP